MVVPSNTNVDIDTSSIPSTNPCNVGVFVPNETYMPATESFSSGNSAQLENVQRPTQPIFHRSSRVTTTPSYLQNYHCGLLHSNIVPSDVGQKFPLKNFLSYNRLTPTYRNFILNVSAAYEPQYYHQVVPHAHWHEAMNNELLAMEANKTWLVVPLSSGLHSIGCKWVYKVKHKADGSIERYKARLVAKGYTQQEGLDYIETFSPVAKLVTVKVLLTLAVSFQWPLIKLDVNNAFLHGDLYEEVYIDLPLGYKHNVVSQGERLVCKLNKSIYGLKQASRQWFDKFSHALLLLGFKQSKSDYFLFTRGSGTTFLALLVYVNDIIITGASLEQINSLKSHLNDVFKLKDLDSLWYFLGLELARSSKGVFLCQRNYTLQLLEDTGFLASEPASLPMDPNIKTHSSEGILLVDPTEYRRLIGRLLYLTISRTDISFTVHKLSQFVAQPRSSHMVAAHTLLRYLKGCSGEGIFLSATTDFQLRAFTDVDWASCIDTRKSTSGFCVFSWFFPYILEV